MPLPGKPHSACRAVAYAITRLSGNVQGGFWRTPLELRLSPVGTTGVAPARQERLVPPRGIVGVPAFFVHRLPVRQFLQLRDHHVGVIVAAISAAIDLRCRAVGERHGRTRPGCRSARVRRSVPITPRRNPFRVYLKVAVARPDGFPEVFDGGQGGTFTAAIDCFQSGGRGLPDVVGKALGGSEAVCLLTAGHALCGVHSAGTGQRKGGVPVCVYPQHHRVRNTVGVPGDSRLGPASPSAGDHSTVGQNRSQSTTACQREAAGHSEESSSPGESGEPAENGKRDRPRGGCSEVHVLGCGAHHGSMPINAAAAVRGGLAVSCHSLMRPSRLRTAPGRAAHEMHSVGKRASTRRRPAVSRRSGAPVR